MTQLLTEIIQKTESLTIDEQRTLFCLLEKRLGNSTNEGSHSLQPSISEEISESEDADSSGLQSIMELAKKIAENIPEEELAKLPTDGAEQHDHYIYGTPKI